MLFFRQRHLSKLFSVFEQRIVPGALYSSSVNWSFFHWENFVKTKINGTLKAQCLVNIVDKSELSSQVVTISAWLSEKHAVLHYPDGRPCMFCWLILDTSLSTAFSWFNWEQYLLEFIIWLFRRRKRWAGLGLKWEWVALCPWELICLGRQGA